MAEHGVKIRVMKQISEGTKEIIYGRCRDKEIRNKFMECSALALIHGDVCDLIYASDLAEKAADTTVFEIGGNCPQHMTCLGIMGDSAAVDEAVKRIKQVFDL